MGIVNRRNAVIGWAAWSVGKQVALRKARRGRLAPRSEPRRPWKAGAVALAAVAVGGVVLWRLRAGGTDPELP